MVGYKPYVPKNPTKPISVTGEYRDLETAHFWRLLPSEFRSQPVEEKAQMMAYMVVSKEIEAYYHSESLKRMDKEREEGKNQRSARHR